MKTSDSSSKQDVPLKQRHRRMFYVCLFLFTIFVYTVLPWFNLITNLELGATDVFFQLRNFFQVQKPPDNIVVVAIDEASMEEFNKPWPWSRRLHGDLVSALSDAGAAAILFDVVFSEPDRNDPSADEYFADKVRAAGNVILAEYEGEVKDKRYNLRTSVLPIQVLKDATSDTGFIAISLDNDGFMRRISLTTSGVESFSLAAIHKYLAARGDPEGENYKKLLQSIPGGMKEPLIINYLGKPRSIDTVSYYQALNYKTSLNKNYFRDKIVVVGFDLAVSADLTRTDHYNYPFLSSSNSQIPGVEVQATIMDTILRGRFIQPISYSVQFITFLTLLIIVAMILWRSGNWPSIVLFFLILAALPVAQFILFFNWQYTSNVVTPLMALMTFFLFERVYSYAYTDREKRFIRQAFSRYISPDVVNELLKDPDKLKLQGEKYETTVIFTDLVGFTSLSESMDPEDLRDFLSEYFGEMVEAMLAQNGTLDKFIGDAMMCFFGVPIRTPEHPEQAVSAAWDMYQRLQLLNRLWAEQEKEPLDMRIGINTGPVTAGNMGTHNVLNYTIMGDTVNLGARLESANKQYGTNIMLGETTYEKVKDKFDTRRLDCIRVKGKEQGVFVYELLGPVNTIQGERAEQIRLYESAFKDYLNQEFQSAINKLEQVLKIGNDQPSLVLKERCEVYLQSPPGEDWDGVYTMTSK